MACALLPWLHLTGRSDELREAADEIVEAVGDQWSGVLATDPMARALSAAGELDRLRTFAEALAGAAAPKVGRMAGNLAVAEGLVFLAEGRDEEAAKLLGAAAAEERRLGMAFDGACIALDQARALDAAGQAGEAVLVRAEAEQFLSALKCVNPL